MDATTILIREFLAEIDNYQEDHFGRYPRQRLVNAYKDLPEELKSNLTPLSTKQHRLWHRCDGISEKRDYMQGLYIIPFGGIKSHGGLIDGRRVYNLSLKHAGFEVSDDEGEVIVILPVWHEAVNLNDIDLKK